MASDSGSRGGRARALVRYAIPAAVVVPTVTALAVLALDHRRLVSFETTVAIWVELEIFALGAVSVLTAFAIRAAESRRRATELRLEELAHRDALTGLLNRRGLEAELGELAVHPPGDPSGPGLILVDLDDFKRINDTRGHATGDRLLVAAARALDRVAGPHDLVARLGGDEFAVVIADGGEEAWHWAEEMAAAVAEAAESIGVPAFAASTGVALAAGLAEDGSLPVLDRWLEEADRELYAAKGRPMRPAQAPPGAEATSPSPDPVQAPAPSMPRLDEAVVRRLRALTLPCAAIAGAIGVAGMIGVLFDLLWLRAANEEAALAFTSSLAIALLAASMALAADENGPRGRFLLSYLAAGAVALLAVGTLVERGFGVDLGFNRLVHDPLDVPEIFRPDSETAVGVLMASLYLLAIDVRRPLVRTIWAVMTIAVLLAAAGAIFSALLGAGYLWQPGDADLISMHGTVAAAALCVGLLTMRPRRVVFWPLTIASPAGHTTRRLMAAAIAVPLLTGMLLVSLGRSDALPLLAAVLTLVQVALLLLIARTTARTVAVADAESEALAAQLRELADSDPLTGLFNRRRMEFEFAEEVDRRNRAGGSSALIVLDLDSLKRINDTQGHAAGDAAVVLLARTLRDRTRPTDTVARIGGDEFAVLLAGVDMPGARAWADSCADAVAQGGPGDGPGVQVSWGAAEFDATAGSFDELFHAADVELYAAKRGPVE